MLQKVICSYTTPISQFKANPNAAIQEANGEPVAVTEHNQVKFYAVPTDLFQELIGFCEYAQRGTTELKHSTARFTGSTEKSMEESAISMAKRLVEMGGAELKDYKKGG
ncbi:hypothetical protein ACJJIF_08480 [Microbulbifer sp. SSSA002]|uniref:hypothetical protein n=1 Tax=Microbulbifer sp. SSSA002 TaxID=3243376 RepID=UPI00403967BF